MTESVFKYWSSIHEKPNCKSILIF